MNQFSVVSSQFPALVLRCPWRLPSQDRAGLSTKPKTVENRELTTGFLAGPLGFEPRQSAPKALDLPLVDGPAPPTLTIFNCRLKDCLINAQPTTADRQSKIFCQYLARFRVLVTWAAISALARRPAASLAAALDRNKPYTAEPDPDSEA